MQACAGVCGCAGVLIGGVAVWCRRGGWCGVVLGRVVGAYLFCSVSCGAVVGHTSFSSLALSRRCGVQCVLYVYRYGYRYVVLVFLSIRLSIRLSYLLV